MHHRRFHVAIYWKQNISRSDILKTNICIFHCDILHDWMHSVRVWNMYFTGAHVNQAPSNYRSLLQKGPLKETVFCNYILHLSIHLSVYLSIYEICEMCISRSDILKTNICVINMRMPRLHWVVYCRHHI